jgi:hypothetical protein
MEGSFPDMNEDRRNREILFNKIINNIRNHPYAEMAANQYVYTKTGMTKPLKEITIGDGVDLFDRKVELLLHYIKIARDNNEENELQYNQNTGEICDRNRPQCRPQSENRTVFGRLIGGAMVNQKVKKCEKKKVVLGKERCIYKVSGSKKDYMKYKGELVAVSDYVKSMKKKN